MSNLNHIAKGRFRTIQALRCEAATISGSLAEAARPELKDMALFYCDGHQIYHAYPVESFHELADAAIEHLLQEERAKFAYQYGKNFGAELAKLLSSKTRTLSKIDKQFHSDNHRLVQSQDRTERLQTIIDGCGFAPELLDEYYACYRKIPHALPSRAQKHMADLLTSEDHVGGVMEVYQCSYCTGWHIGHLSMGRGSRPDLERRYRAIKLLRRSDPAVIADFCAEKGIQLLG